MKRVLLSTVLACLSLVPAIADPPTAEQAVKYYRDCMSWQLGAAQCKCRTKAAVKLTDFDLLTIINSGRPASEQYQQTLQAISDQVFETCKVDLTR